MIFERREKDAYANACGGPHALNVREGRVEGAFTWVEFQVQPNLQFRVSSLSN